MIARSPAKDDPRAMEQRFLCFALFENRGGLLSRSLEGVDHQQLIRDIEGAAATVELRSLR